MDKAVQMTKTEAIKAFAKRGKGLSNTTDWERGETVSAGNQKVNASTATPRTVFEMHLPSASMLRKCA